MKNQTQDPYQRSEIYIPVCSVAYVLIISTMVIGSSLIFYTGQPMKYFNDADGIIFGDQWYRLFTAPFAIYSRKQMFSMIFSFIWLWYYLPIYEKKYSTIWTVFHFVMFNIIIQLSMVTLSFLLFKISTLKQFMLISGGIIPYCLYLFLKVSEINPNQEVFFCCSPFPVSSAKRNWVVALLFIWFSTQPHQCIFITIYWAFKNCCCCCKCCSICTCCDGPLCPKIISCFEKFVPENVRSSEYFFPYIKPEEQIPITEEQPTDCKQKLQI